MAAPTSTTVIVLVARFCLGIIFLSSAFGKLADMRSFAQGMIAYRILLPALATIVAVLLPPIELFLGLMFLFGVALPVAGSFSVVTLLCFTGAVIVNVRRGRRIACNCHGLVGSRTINRGLVARNGVLMALAITIVALAPNATSLGQWLNVWRGDLSLLASIPTALLLALLLSFCFVLLQLVEWAVLLHERAGALRQAVRS